MSHFVALLFNLMVDKGGFDSIGLAWLTSSSVFSQFHHSLLFLYSQDSQVLWMLLCLTLVMNHLGVMNRIRSTWRRGWWDWEDGRFDWILAAGEGKSCKLRFQSIILSVKMQSLTLVECYVACRLFRRHIKFGERRVLEFR